MNFKVSTKPLSDALALGVVNANVSKFYRKSCLAQVTADKHNLRINLEAAFIFSEIRLKGIGDVESTVSVFVDSLLLKQLVSTLDSSTVTLEFTEGGLILHSGKSKFTLPKMIDEVELELKAPSVPEGGTVGIDINKSDWKFIKENQMYAIAMSFIHPVYTRVWLGAAGDVLVGDFDNSLFTHSKKSKLGKTCLVSDTIVNLFNSLPEGSQLVDNGNTYLIICKTDGFEMVTEFTPQYESDENVGSYNSEIILEMMKHPESSIKVSTKALTKFLGQADLLSNSSEDTIHLVVNNTHNQLYLKDRNVECTVDVQGTIVTTYDVEFKTSMLKSVLSNYNEDEIYISPMEQGGAVVGIVVWSSDLTTVLAGVE